MSAVACSSFQKIHDAKNKAADYLTKNVQSAQSPFIMAITSYALALVDVNHHSAQSTFSALKKEAFVTGITKFSV